MTDLSPAAQEVLCQAIYIGPELEKRVAAAIRALADQVVPEQPEIPKGELREQTYRWDERSGIRAHILAIATELENAQ